MRAYNKPLNDFSLHYEELEKKVEPKKQVKRVNDVTESKKGSKKDTPSSTNIFRRSALELKPAKKVTNNTKNERKISLQQKFRVILGIGLLFVVVSIIYSSYVIFNGVDSSASRVLLIPQVVFALTTLFKAFSKIYK